MNYIKKALKFLNLVDRSGNLSITNIAVIVCITKIAMAPEFSMAEIGALLVSLMNYAHKRVETAKLDKSDLSIMEEKIRDVVEKLKS